MASTSKELRLLRRERAKERKSAHLVFQEAWENRTESIYDFARANEHYLALPKCRVQFATLLQTGISFDTKPLTPDLYKAFSVASVQGDTLDQALTEIATVFSLSRQYSAAIWSLPESGIFDEIIEHNLNKAYDTPEMKSIGERSLLERLAQEITAEGNFQFSSRNHFLQGRNGGANPLFNSRLPHADFSYSLIFNILGETTLILEEEGLKKVPNFPFFLPCKGDQIPAFSLPERCLLVTAPGKLHAGPTPTRRRIVERAFADLSPVLRMRISLESLKASLPDWIMDGCKP